MKPHARLIRGKWRVFRDRSASPWALPTVVKEGLVEAFKAHFKYVGG